MKKIVVFVCFILCSLNLVALQWSNKSADRMSWFDAVRYCRNLNEGGYNDWRLPSVPQFRELVQNCPGFELRGQCRLTDDCIYLHGLDEDDNTCLNGCDNCPYNEQKYYPGYYSKLGDKDELWTSMIFDAGSKGIEALTWWHSGHRFMEDDHLFGDYHHVRCVRFPKSINGQYIKMSNNEAERIYIEAQKLAVYEPKKARALLLKIMNSADIYSVQYEKAKELMLYISAYLESKECEDKIRQLQNRN